MPLCNSIGVMYLLIIIIECVLLSVWAQFIYWFIVILYYYCYYY